MAKTSMTVADLAELLARAPQEAKIYVHIDDEVGLLRGEMTNGAWDTMNKPGRVDLVAIRVQP